MTTGTKGIRYPEMIDRLKQRGIDVPDKPGAPWHDVQCPGCAAHNPADMSLRVQSRQHNAELACRNACDQVLILRALGFRGVQQVEMPPPRTDGEARSGQVRTAYRLGRSENGKLLYVNGLGWHCWNGERFKLDDTGAAKRAVLNVMAAALGRVDRRPGATQRRTQVRDRERYRWGASRRIRAARVRLQCR
jgi:putative DNA primase/helicase